MGHLFPLGQAPAADQLLNKRATIDARQFHSR